MQFPKSGDFGYDLSSFQSLATSATTEAVSKVWRLRLRQPLNLNNQLRIYDPAICLL